MSIGLLDVNVLIALAWPSHVHHRHAHAWFAANQSADWATCPLTQCVRAARLPPENPHTDALEVLTARD